MQKETFSETSCTYILASLCCVLARSLMVQPVPDKVLPVEDLLVDLGWGQNSQELSPSLVFQCDRVAPRVVFHMMEQTSLPF